MSDDEYYYDEFDEFHEMLYDADAGPDLADDLAEHAAHSPVWQENPIEELRDYFSDWEYYSDDYFDDDPKLVGEERNTVRSSRKQTRQPPKRGRKRKLSEVGDVHEHNTEEMAALTSCLRGTVWKGKSPEPGEFVKLGVEKPVALKLSNHIMRTAYSKKRGFGKLVHDESWANDMSLADMGLTTERGMGVHDPNAADPSVVVEEDDDADENVEGSEAEMLDEEAVEIPNIIEGPHQTNLQTELSSSTAGTVQSQTESNGRPRKRRRVSSSAAKDNEAQLDRQKAPLPTPASSLDSEGADDNNTTSDPPKKRRGQPKKVIIPPQTQQPASEGNITNHPERKRKLSHSDSSVTASTASSRAKRVAIEAPVVKTAASNRPARVRKK